MKIIEGLIQGSKEWHEFRKTHVGASNGAAILGLCKYQTAFSLWEEKTERSFGVHESEAMTLGKTMEPKIRAKWENITGKKFDTPTAEHDDYPIISASFDGYCHEDESIIEIKHSKHEKLSKCIKTEDVGHFNELYPNYYIQCQQLMLVSKAKECTVVTVDPYDEIASIEIPRDDDFIEQELIPGIQAFWNDHVLPDIEPPLSDKDYLYIEDAEAIEIAQAFIDIAEQRKSLQEQEKQLKQSLANYGDDGSFIVGNVLKMTRYNRESTNYKQACEDYDIDLSKYKKTSIGHYRITPIK